MNLPDLTFHEPTGPWADKLTLTANESWTLHRYSSFWYDACADFALDKLVDGEGKSCLVIGSPLFEALELADSGWNVTYLDVRERPNDAEFSSLSSLSWLKADATNIPLSDASVDAVSSTCVLCHAGMGRYGDVSYPGGDLRMLSEIARVLKPDGVATIGVGPTAKCDGIHLIGKIHRVYSPTSVLMLCSAVGLEVVKLGIFSFLKREWLTIDEYPTDRLDLPDYLCAFLRKRTA